jgi:hypothetical protein
MKLKNESEDQDVSADTGSGIDERRISRLRARLRSEEMLHALLKNPQWLESLAKTTDHLKAYQELLDQWQSDGCPDLESWLAKDSPMLRGKAIVQASGNNPISFSTPSATSLSSVAEGHHHLDR